MKTPARNNMEALERWASRVLAGKMPRSSQKPRRKRRLSVRQAILESAEERKRFELFGHYGDA